MARSGLGLQDELAMHGHDAAATLVQRAAASSILPPELLDQFDAITLVLFVATLIAFFVPVLILFPPVPVERSDALGQTHSRLGLAPKRSNLLGQQPPRTGEQPPTVQSLHIYPVKSCRGIELARSKVLPTGLEHDRLYTFAQLCVPATGQHSSTGDGKQTKPLWEFLTQSQFPLLETVRVDLWVPDPAKSSRQLGRVDDAFLVLRFPWMDHGWRGLIQWIAAKISRGLRAVPEKEFMLPVSLPSNQDITERGYTFADVKIWEDVICALNLETEIPPELSKYLGVKNRLGLFRMDPSGRREVSRCEEPQSAPEHPASIFFQDGYPLHMLSFTSVQNSDSLLPNDEAMKGLDARGFRANITISGSKEYEEEAWNVINLKHPSTKEECRFNVACRTVRWCKLPDVDAEMGIQHQAEPDRALRKLRNVDASAPIMGCLGMQLCPMISQPSLEEKELVSYIEVGMCIDVLEQGSHVNIKQ